MANNISSELNEERMMLMIHLICVRNLRDKQIWRHLVEKMFQEDKGFRALCLLNDWWQHLPGRGGERAEDCEEKCRAIVYKVELQTNHQRSF